MQLVQNAAAKFVFNKLRRDSATDCCYKLHWLPVAARIDYKICTLVYKCRHGCAPKYLSELLEGHTVRREGLRSANVVDRLTVPETKRKTFSARSFRVMGPTLWNSLPNNVKMASSLEEFKSSLKTFFV